MTAVVIARLLLWSLKRGPWPWPAPGDNPLLFVEQHVAAEYPELVQLTLDELAGRPTRDADSVVLFDVRSAEEHAVSHLPGAIRLKPTIGADEFVTRFGRRISGCDVVFYCAVGLRSARLADRLSPTLKAIGAHSIANLRGGIFRWSNEKRPMTGPSGETRELHPFSAFWSRFLLP